MNELEAFVKKQIDSTPWYHNIELLEGLTTSGRRNANASIVRKILNNVNVEGIDCIDIGTVDGFYGVLLSRRKAKSVLCTDRANRSAQISLVRSFTNEKFDYYPGLSILDLRKLIEKNTSGPVGFINFAGVLYHMMDPFGGIAMVRGLVKKGGMVLVDTPAIFDGEKNDLVLTPDDFYSETTFFTPTLRCLQSMLEFVGLKPIDCAYYLMKRKIDDREMLRISIACRAVNPPIFDSDVNAKTKSVIRTNLLESIYYSSIFEPMGDRMEMTSHEAVTPYLLDGRETRVEEEIKINLFEKCKRDDPTPYNDSHNVLLLKDR